MGTAEVAGRQESFLRTEVVDAANSIEKTFAEVRRLSDFYSKNGYNSGGSDPISEADLEPFYFDVATFTNFHTLLLELINFATGQAVGGGSAFPYVQFAERICSISYPIVVPGTGTPELKAKQEHVNACIALADIITKSSRDLEKIVSLHYSNSFNSDIGTGVYDLFRFSSSDYSGWVNMAEQLGKLFFGDDSVTPGFYLDVNAKIKDA